jgi:hypothetical protein
MGPPGLPGPKTSVPPVPVVAKEPSPQSAPVRPHPVLHASASHNSQQPRKRQLPGPAVNRFGDTEPLLVRPPATGSRGGVREA